MVWNEELGKEIPEGWGVEKLGHIFDFLEGPGITKDKYCNDDKGQNFINIKCLDDGFIDISTCNKIQKKFLKGYEKFQLEENDILISTSGTLGVYAIVTSENLPLLLNTSIIRFRAREPKFYSYMFSFISSEYFKKLLYKYSTGSVQKNIGPTHLEEFSLLIPKVEVIEQYNVILSSIIKRKIDLRKESKELCSLRDFLLPVLMNGQVEFNENINIKDIEVGKEEILT